MLYLWQQNEQARTKHCKICGNFVFLGLILQADPRRPGNMPLQCPSLVWRPLTKHNVHTASGSNPSMPAISRRALAEPLRGVELGKMQEKSYKLSCRPDNTLSLTSHKASIQHLCSCRHICMYTQE